MAVSLPAFDAISTGEDWSASIELEDADTGSAVDFTGFTAWSLEARKLTPNGVGSAVVTASYGAGITFPDGLSGGVLDITLRTPFADQESGTYRILITATNGTDTIQLVSHLPVLNLTESPA